jgi:thiol-disulfide isomerase/thioredoxin
MARTPSTMMLELGSQAPAFTLPDYGAGAAAGKQVSLDQVASPGGQARPFVVMFLCNHCPFVKHVRDQLGQLGKDYEGRVGFVGVNPNDVANYPDDRPELMAVEAKTGGYTFPYLYDATQEVAKTYKAACTPDFFLFDKSRRLVYRGQMDDSRPGSGVPTAQDLRAAIDAALAGKTLQQQKPSMGCNIKWKAGNEPAYYSA